MRDTGVARTGIEFGGTTEARPGEQRSWVAGFYPVDHHERRLVGVVLLDVTEHRRAQGEEIVLRVADDGAGYAPGRLTQALAAGAIGIASCRERVEAVGGRLDVHSAPGAGTHATARIPRDRPTSGQEEGGISCLDERPDGA